MSSTMEEQEVQDFTHDIDSKSEKDMMIQLAKMSVTKNIIISPL